MNIFVSSFDPKESAIVLDDLRLRKMILESAQILSTVMNLNGLKGPYKTTHKNHPVVKWVQESRKNYWWLVEHFQALCEEYDFRFNKIHKCYQYRIDFIIGHSELIKNDKLTNFVNCTKFKEIKEVTYAYRLALIDKWKNDKRPPKWSKTNPPEWLK